MDKVFISSCNVVLGVKKIRADFLTNKVLSRNVRSVFLNKMASLTIRTVGQTPGVTEVVGENPVLDHKAEETL